MYSPVRTISFAFSMPTRRGSRWVDSWWGKDTGIHLDDAVLGLLAEHAEAGSVNSKPPAMPAPLTPATNGVVD
jgi:hypothetical protein